MYSSINVLRHLDSVAFWGIMRSDECTKVHGRALHVVCGIIEASNSIT